MSDGPQTLVTGVHIGKVLIHTTEAGAGEPVATLQPMGKLDIGYSAEEQPAKGILDTRLHARGHFWARKDRSYVITGGLGGFGLALAVWLARQGAGHIVLSSKRWRFPRPLSLRNWSQSPSIFLVCLERG